MKKLLLITLVSFCANNIIAQNVGIGTAAPTDKLSVVNALPGYGITHTYGPVTMGTYISNLFGQFGTKTNHPLQFFTNNGAAQLTLLQNGNFGIGLSAPTVKLDVYGSIKAGGANGEYAFNDRADNNSGYSWYSNLGSAKLFRYGAVNENALIITANNFIGIKTQAPQTNLHIDPAGAGSILIGTNKSSGGYTNLEIGISAQSNGQSYIQSTKASGSTWGTLQLNPFGGDITTGGNVGIGTNTPFSPLDVVQNGNALRILSPGHIWSISVQSAFLFSHNNVAQANISGTDGSYFAFSDKRLKKNIDEISPVLDRVLQLKAKNYLFINAEETTKKSLGFISQEVIGLFPELVNSFKRTAEDPTLYLGLNYAGFSVIAIKAIQEQQQQIDTANEKNKMMMRMIEKMQQQIDALTKK